ncbi:MAG: short-chain fatty acyl-CoA regulator family protein [Pseudomonadota bacterium]
MSRPSLVGSRIRERRMVVGRKQSDLARSVGISPSYLNLIEHNRRRIGGKLVQEIARELRVDVTQLTEGAEAALINSLREAAADHTRASEELPRLEEFVGRFPGLAQLMLDTRRRSLDLERTVEVLSDRMTHDPFLSASMHEVLSTVTAIRSTATILVETDDIDPEWQTRFHRNIAEESMRLAESAEALVRYLDDGASPEFGAQTPLEELDLWLAEQDYHVAEMERALAPEPADLVARAEALESAAAQDMAKRYLERVRRDVEHMPLSRMKEVAEETGLDPAAMALRFGVDLGAMFRRLAAMPPDILGGAIGLVACDASGTLTFRKPVEGFSVPRYSAACPLWPLYQALSRPVAPVRQVVEMGGRAPLTFLTYSLCQPLQPAGFDGPQVMEAQMLVVPLDLALSYAQGAVGVAEQAVALPIGTSCRICPRAACAARREPSIMGITA